METIEKTHRATAAYVSHPNTPESDLQRFVEHDVCVKMDGGGEFVVRLMATDPGDAIDKINAMPTSYVARMKRIEEGDPS